MIIKVKAAAAAATAMLVAGAASAQDDAAAATYKFSGFGTIGVAHSNSKEADFVSSFYFQPNGVGKTRAWSASVDSRLGAQLTANFGKHWSAVVQVVSEQQWDNTWRPGVEWANVKYAFTPDFSVRVGRILLPTYMQSESRKVGYTNPWVRPPVELYNLFGVTKSDGVDATYRLRIGAVTNTASALFGKTKVTISGGADADLRKIYGLSNQVEYGALTARVSYQNMRMSMPALAGLNNFGCVRCEADVPLSIANAGATYDPGEWFVTGEWARSRLDQGSFHIGGVKSTAYVTAGYRLDKFTPYLTYAQIEQPVTAVPGDSVQKTVSAGLRWDFLKNADLKLQYDRVRPGSGSMGFFVNGVPSDTSVVSAAVDFVF
ncbi:hypothetical protein [Pseudoduganella namucuonensis]|uniref:Outer membrane protein (Porin) n=1 Tax=Pseudoduganella namucuonensis TaxID=1035707 RepID=A0A1I7M689_9BURK|nr:hypothetical protein [Pseudoduganella namucuonensis]SFV17469.1 Outer membrane protein (porin) [Pseudoduganella namucuonensis]